MDNFNIEQIKEEVYDFDDEHIIEEVILLGHDGSIKRIKFLLEFNVQEDN